ncbi:MAG: hypothetical protein LIR50_11630 [Bacillota bacterium]|nr:hypothetical protein [Bacillota bacterium]
MSDISSVRMPNNEVYDLKDSYTRDLLSTNTTTIANTNIASFETKSV